MEGYFQWFPMDYTGLQGFGVESLGFRVLASQSCYEFSVVGSEVAWNERSVLSLDETFFWGGSFRKW